MLILLRFQAHFEYSQFELHRADGRKLLRSDAIPTVFNILTPRMLLVVKRPVAASMENLADTDHVYSKRLCLQSEKENSRPELSEALPTSSSAELQEMPLSQDISVSQATMSDSLSQFIAAKTGDDKALISSLRKRVRRIL